MQTPLLFFSSTGVCACSVNACMRLASANPSPAQCPTLGLPSCAALQGNDLAPSNPAAYMPFGGGPRLCVGNKFALQEARVALVRLVQRFRLALAPGAPRVPALATGITMTPKDGVVVRLSRREL